MGNQKSPCYRISELPIGKWTSDYQLFLQTLLPSKRGDRNGTVKLFKEKHTDRTVEFEVYLTDRGLEKVETAHPGKLFKLRSSLNESNMVLINSRGILARYHSAIEILKEFAIVRRELFVERKRREEEALSAEVNKLDNQIKYVRMIFEGKLQRGLTEDEMLKFLSENFKPLPEREASQMSSSSSSSSSSSKLTADYSYLIKTPCLFKKDLDTLEKRKEKANDKLEKLQERSAEELWDDELAHLSVELEKRLKIDQLPLDEDDNSESEGLPVTDSTDAWKRMEDEVQRIVTRTEAEEDCRYQEFWENFKSVEKDKEEERKQQLQEELNELEPPESEQDA